MTRLQGKINRIDGELTAIVESGKIDNPILEQQLVIAIKALRQASVCAGLDS